MGREADVGAASGEAAANSVAGGRVLPAGRRLAEIVLRLAKAFSGNGSTPAVCAGRGARLGRTAARAPRSG
jgi:hypothetical protein